METTMFTSLDKAWAGGLAAGLMTEAAKYVAFNEQLELGLTALVAAFIVWLVPNKGA